MIKILEKVNGLVWGVPALIMLVGIGVYLSVRTGFAQFRLFPLAVRRFWGQLLNTSGESEGRSGFRALCTALAATVGTGNIVGVAGAITIGGPGAIFWMWVCAFLGMVTKFAEATLSVRYRTQNSLGEYIGGPMYMIRHGMGQKWLPLAYIYSFFGLVASFGVGNATQINAVIGGVNSTAKAFRWQIPGITDLFIGLGLGAIITIMLLGGAKRIGETAEILVPVASCGYLLVGIFVLVIRHAYVPRAFLDIIAGAFDPKAVTGGVVGSALAALRVGASRGVFTNEAGMGTAAIAHGGADVAHPVDQGLMGIMEVFLDTVVICTMTALVILCSGTVIPYGTDIGAELTVSAFSGVLGQWVNIFITLSLCLFALATVLGWGLYGMRCAEFLFGSSSVRLFALAQGCVVVLGAVMKSGTVWTFAEIVNGLMVIPNLIALGILSPELISLVKEYKESRCNNKHCSG